MADHLQQIPSAYGPLRIWQDVQPGREYVIGVDTAEGKVRDKAVTSRHTETATSARDFSAACVIDRYNAALVALWHGTIDTHKYSIVVYNLARWYNDALVAIEVTGPGRAVQDNLTNWGYPNCWVARRPQFADPSPGENIEFGWKTNHVTRPILIRSLHEMIGSDAIIVPGMIPSMELLSEMKTMEVDDQGKERGIGRNKDDCVMAYGVAIQVRKESLELSAPEKKDERYKELPDADRKVWQQFDRENDELENDRVKDIEEMDYVE